MLTKAKPRAEYLKGVIHDIREGIELDEADYYFLTELQRDLATEERGDCTHEA